MSMEAHRSQISNFGTILLWFVSTALSACFAQPHYLVCDDGYGSFENTFATGVTVAVGATKSGGLSGRSCAGELDWKDGHLQVAMEASQVDVDVMGADLGLGVPVVSFQVRKSSADWAMTYQIYSLQKPPMLIRSITGGDFFRAADTNLNGKIEIWTTDIEAVNGFENFVAGEFDSAPTVVLRFEHNQLIDVSTEFQPYFDEQISKLRTELAAKDVADFRRSDGRLTGASILSSNRTHELRTTKLKALEIVWCYLYSGREQEAWQTLDDMWPASDYDRIRIAILNARAHGIRSQIDGVSTKRPSLRLRKHAYVFDAITEPPQGTTGGHFPYVDVRPQPILLRRPTPSEGGEPLTRTRQMLELVVDSAGKVSSVKPIDFSDNPLIYAALGWKFIPAFALRHAVASRLRIEVSTSR